MDIRKTNRDAILEEWNLTNEAAKLLQLIEKELEIEKDEVYKKWYIAMLPAAWRPSSQIPTNQETMEMLIQLQPILVEISEKASQTYVKVDEPLQLLQYDTLQNVHKSPCWEMILNHQVDYDLLQVRELIAFLAEVQLTLTEALTLEEKLLNQGIALNIEEQIRKEN